VGVAIASELGAFLDPQFRIRFVDELGPATVALTKVDMIDPRDGIKYVCALPDISQVQTQGKILNSQIQPLVRWQKSFPTAEAEPELPGPPANVLDFLEPLDGTCMYRVRRRALLKNGASNTYNSNNFPTVDWRLVGVWILLWYENCNATSLLLLSAIFEGSKIRQYHQEKEQVVAEFYLGRGPSSSAPSTKEYYAEIYAEGTTCDITGAVRALPLSLYHSLESRF
jgi:hypothetical protein